MIPSAADEPLRKWPREESLERSLRELYGRVKCSVGSFYFVYG